MIYLLIEFIDELVFGVGEAAWPLIRNDLGLNYFQIGLALSLPGLLANFIEPFIFILGDVWKRRAIILLLLLARALAGHYSPRRIVFYHFPFADRRQ